MAHANAFAKHVAALNALLERVRRDHPDANFYLAGDDLHLLSDESHDADGTARRDRVLASVTLHRSGGGDW